MVTGGQLDDVSEQRCRTQAEHMHTCRPTGGKSESQVICHSDKQVDNQLVQQTQSYLRSGPSSSGRS